MSSSAPPLVPTGVHRPRVFGLAAFDLLATGLLAAGAAYATGHRSLVAMVLVFIILVVFSMAVHRALGVRTALTDRVLGPMRQN